MIKIIFFDVDGTLRDFATGRIPESAKAAIARARAAGILTGVATGRHLAEMETDAMLEDLQFDVYVTTNGQYCFALEPESSVGEAAGKRPPKENGFCAGIAGEGKTQLFCIGGDQASVLARRKRLLYANPIARDQVEKMVGMIEAEAFPCVFLLGDEIYINMVNDDVYKVQADIKSSVPPVKPLRTALEQPVYQMIPYLGPERGAELRRRLDKCEAILWHDSMAFDVIPKGSGKETGIARVLEQLGIPREACAAVGDGLNDLGMLKYAGLGIAMGNGKPETKAAADYVTDDIAADGLAKAIDYILARQ